MAPNKGPQLSFPRVSPIGHHEGHGRMPSPAPQNTCGMVRQTPLNPPAPCRECRAGAMFHGWGKNHTAPPSCEGGQPPRSASPEALSSPRNVEEVCQLRQSHNIQKPEVLKVFNPVSLLDIATV
ncbi:hypothetical protein CHARACLAT_030471 [Characodon lateralis]|uniref:Uncharacterized protein n=1 Tax=Characodon lateralis TaxID=208331 RepID=A0ABU7CWK7_9TELE|nr:hypothetical protein [Characodon lateralis]